MLFRSPDSWSHYGQAPRKKNLSRGASHGERDWSIFKGVCLHQTAALIKSDHRKLLAIPAHDIVTWDNRAIVLHDGDDYMWHAGALNRYTTGVEIACRAAGTEGDRSTLWIGPSDKAKGFTYESLCREPTDEQLALARDMVERRLAEAVLHGCTLRNLGIYAHRQSSAHRLSDPGSRIWQHVALPLTRKYKLRDTSQEVFDTGRPIPRSWK